MKKIRTRPQLNIEIEPELNQELENACSVLFRETKVKTTKADFVRQAISEKVGTIAKSFPEVREVAPV